MFNIIFKFKFLKEICLIYMFDIHVTNPFYKWVYGRGNQKSIHNKEKQYFYNK